MLCGRGGGLSRRDAEERARARRLRRLREELVDEQVPLPIDGAAGDVLLSEILYARYPPVHERSIPRYGSIVIPGEARRWQPGPNSPEVVELEGIDEPLARRFADGSGSFLMVGTEGIRALACFASPVGYEATLARLQESAAATVVQRTDGGEVRVFTAEGVVEWDGLRWTFKPHTRYYEAPVRRLAPEANPDILRGLLEFCAYWLSPGNVGATLLWELGGDPDGGTRGLDLSRADDAPPLRLTRREHFPALLSMLAQMDRAAIVDPNGELKRVGVTLVPTPRAIELVAPTGGTRHTSARRFSFDRSDSLVFVVSEDGPVSVFSDGARAATVRADPCQSDFLTREQLPNDPDPAGERIVPCPRCEQPLLLDEVRIAGWTGDPERLSCPVCNQEIVLDVYRAAIRGVRKAPR